MIGFLFEVKGIFKVIKIQELYLIQGLLDYKIFQKWKFNQYTKLVRKYKSHHEPLSFTVASSSTGSVSAST